jgi:hypothetical protein
MLAGSPLARRLGAETIGVRLAGPAPRFEPWGSGAPLALADVARAHVLTLLAVVDDRMVFAARPRGEAAPVAGGAAPLTGALAGITGRAGAAITLDALRGAASAAAIEALAGTRVADLRARLDAVIAAGLHAPLRAAGFRTGPKLSLRITGHAAQWVKLTLSRFATPIEVGFDLTLGVAFGPFGARRPTEETLLSEGEPALLRPIASLWGRQVAGYAIRPDSDDAALAARIEADVALRAMPWFAQLATPEAVIGFLAAEDAARGTAANAAMIGMLHARAGRIAEARAAFATTPGPREAVAALAARFGVTLA